MQRDQRPPRCPWRRRLGRARRDDGAVRDDAERHALVGAVGHARAVERLLRDQPPRRVGRHHGSRRRQGGRDRHRLSAARRHREPDHPRLRLHRRRARRERRQRPRLRRLRPGRLDHERRERERLLRGLRDEQQLVARHARVGHDRAVANNKLGVVGISWVADPAAPGARQVRRLHERHRGRDPLGGRAAVAGVPANPTPIASSTSASAASGACDATIQSAIDAAVAAGTVVVVAAGQQQRDASGFSPANCNNVITVAATGHTGSRAYYSNYGSSVEIAAPGGDSQLGKTILSTLNTGTTTPGADAYANYQGTSMATPHVVGVVSLMLSVNPSLTPAQVTSMLQLDRDAVPGREHAAPRRRAAPASSTRPRPSRRRGGGGGPTPPGAFGKTSPANLAPDSRERRRRCSGARAPARRATPTASTRSNDSSCRHAWVERRRGDVGDRQRPRPGREVLLAGAGDQHDRRHGGGRRRVAHVLDAGRVALPGAFSKTRRRTARGTGRRNVASRWGASTGATSYQWCVATSAASLHDVTSTSAARRSVGDLPRDDLLLAGAGAKRRRDDGREQRHPLVVQDAIAGPGRGGGVRLQSQPPATGATTRSNP